MTKRFGEYSKSIPALLFALSLALAPLYVWRFSIDIAGVSLPTNLLMIFLFAVIGALLLLVLMTQKWSDFKSSLLSLGNPILWAIGLFSLASIISLLAFGVTADKLAQWVVLYLQPLSIFLLIRYFANSVDLEQRNKVLEYIKITAYSLVGVAGVLALIQYFTRVTLPMDWWGNAQEPKRAIAFFAHPNAFGLFITPVLAWLIPDAVFKLQQKKFWPAILWALGGAGILLSLSRGAWLGVLAAVGVYVLVNANKKMLIAFAAALVLMAGIVAAVPNLRYRVLLPFYGEKSSVARLSLWNTGSAMIKDSPLLGKGVNGFKNNWDAYNKDAGLEHYNFPHNIFLNFWIDTGLLGLLSMLGILLFSAIRGLSWKKLFVSDPQKSMAVLGLLLFVVALTVHGLIDIPYFKNDLALAFWLILAISL